MPTDEMEYVKQALEEEKGKEKITKITATWIIKNVKTSEHERALNKIKAELTLLEPQHRESGCVTNLTPNATNTNV